MLAIYTRLSREDSESTSIENQLREGKSFAKDNGFNDIHIYNEGQGVSGGAEIKDRPQLFKLLQDISDNEIKTVWFRNQNRLERNSSTWHIFTTEAKKYKVDIYFNDKLFDFENPQDNLYGTIQSALNQYQKDLQSTQTKR
jgi:site-specific DNA recombinase